MPKLVVGDYQVEWHYNSFANRHFVDVIKNRQCVMSSRALVEGQWPLIGGLIADVDYSRVPNGFSNNHGNTLISFYEAYPINRAVSDPVC